MSSQNKRGLQKMPLQAGSGESRWHKLLSSFRTRRLGPGGCAETHSLKHSHNCANSRLRAGVSNMKGYKKTNQDRCTAFSYLEVGPGRIAALN